jgi:hypothetical protein
MFPDSNLAKTMSCGETKSMYLSCFGIAPYFKSLVEKTAKTNPYIVMFDESLNKELQKKQIDQQKNEHLIKYLKLFDKLLHSLTTYVNKMVKGRDIQIMLAFLTNDLGHVVRSLMNRFIKSSIIEKAPTVQKLCKVDVSKANIYLIVTFLVFLIKHIHFTEFLHCWCFLNNT